MCTEHELLHFGWNCRFLQRDPYPPADWRCAVIIERRAGPENMFLDTRTRVPVDVAARFLKLSEAEVVQRAKAGELEYGYRDNVSKRITIHTEKGPRELTLTEAAKQLKVSIADVEREIENGGMVAYYPDEFMQIVLVNRWAYEKCPLIEEGGRCYYFQPHNGPKIRCLADAGRVSGDRP